MTRTANVSSLGQVGIQLPAYLIALTCLGMAACNPTEVRYVAEAGQRLVIVENIRASDEGRLADIFYHYPDGIALEGEEVRSAEVTRIYRCDASESSATKDGVMTTVDGRRLSHSIKGYQYSHDPGSAIRIVCHEEAAKRAAVSTDRATIIGLYEARRAKSS